MLDNDPTGLETALAQIPVFNEDNKSRYLAYRSIGFNQTESLELLQLKKSTLVYWRSHDKRFAAFENDQLPQLQTGIARQILRLKFQRNFFLIMEKDLEVLEQSQQDFDALSDRQWQWLTNLRKHYTPNDMLALEKALEPEKHNQKVVFNLVWDTNAARLALDDDVIESPEVLELPYGNSD